MVRNRLAAGMNQRRNRPVIIALILLLPAVLLGDFAITRAHLPQKRSTQKPGAARVSELFNNNCARCHGADGAGDTPNGQLYNAPDFTDAEWWRKHPDITSKKSLIAIVTNGKGEMPAFGKKLTPTEIRQLVLYVSQFKQTKSSPPK